MSGVLLAGPMARAGGVDLSIGIGVPGVVFGGPPVYYAPPPPPPRVVVVPGPVYVPGVPYYYGDDAYEHATKRWRKQQERAWKAYRHANYGDDDED